MICALLSSATLVASNAQDPFLDVDALGEQILRDASADNLAQNFVVLAIGQKSYERIASALQELANRGLENSPVGLRLRVGVLETLMLKGTWDEVRREVPSICAAINANPGEALRARASLVGYVWAQAPLRRDEDSHETNSPLTKVEMCRLIREHLDLMPSTDWKFLLNFSTLELSTNGGDWASARVLLDQARPFISDDPQQHVRWLWLSARTYAVLGQTEEASKELERFAELYKEHPGRYSDSCGARLEEFREEIRAAKLRAMGLAGQVAAIEQLLAESVEDLPAGSDRTSAGSSSGSQQDTVQSEIEAESKSLDGEGQASAAYPSGGNRYVYYGVVLIVLSLIICAVVFALRMRPGNTRTLMMVLTGVLLAIVASAGVVKTFALGREGTTRYERPYLVQDIYDLGVKDVNATVEYPLSICNPLIRSVKILSVKTNCSCSVVEGNYDGFILGAGGQTTIHLKAALKHKLGERTLNTLILFQDFAPLVHQARVQVVDPKKEGDSRAPVHLSQQTR